MKDEIKIIGYSSDSPENYQYGDFKKYETYRKEFKKLYGGLAVPQPKIKKPKAERIVSTHNSDIDIYKSKCCYCGIKLNRATFSREHVLPVSKGGKNGENIKPCCKKCNNEKADLTLPEYILFLSLKIANAKKLLKEINNNP